MGAEKVDTRILFNVSVIVIGVVIASFGEIRFVLTGFMFQLGGIFFEAFRLVLVQKLLNSAEYKMDPLVSLYYFAPVCALMNFSFALLFEIPRISMVELYHVGLFTLLLNAMIAFALNVSVVFLVSKPILLYMNPMWLTSADWKDVVSGLDPLWCTKGYTLGLRFDRHLGYPSLRSPILWL